MDSKNLSDVLEVLLSSGITEVILSKTPEGGTLVRGSNAEHSIAVFDVVDLDLVPGTLAIQNLRALVARFQLFENLEILTALDHDVVTELTLKSGRRRSTYRCAAPTSLHVPKRVPGDLTLTDVIEFDAVRVDAVSKAVSAMNMTGSKDRRCVCMCVTDGVATFNILDGDADSFTDEFDVDFPDFATMAWDVGAFQRVLQNSLKAHEDKAVFAVTEQGVVVFDLGIVDVLVTPTIR